MDCNNKLMMKTVFMILILALFTFEAPAQNMCAQLFLGPMKGVARIEAVANKVPGVNISLELEREGQVFSSNVSKALSRQKNGNSLMVNAKEIENYDYQGSRLQEAVDHYNSVLKRLRTRIKEYHQERADLKDHNLRALSNRKIYFAVSAFKDENNGIIKRTSEYFSAVGVNHKIVLRESDKDTLHETFYIVISREGKHFLNKLAHDLYQDKILNKKTVRGYELDIVFDTAQLLIKNAGGLYVKETGHQIILEPGVVLEDSIIRHYLATHEVDHRIAAWLLENGIVKPYHAEIYPQNPSSSLKAQLGNYSEFLSVDELVAYRTSIRILLHDAIRNSQDPKKVDLLFEKIQHFVVLQTNISATVNEVFTELHKMEKLRPHRSSDPRNKEVQVNGSNFVVVAPAKLKIEDTVDMSDFTLHLYTTIGAKLESVSSKSSEEKVKVMRKIARLLSLPSVKKLDGNYPITTEITEMLNE